MLSLHVGLKDIIGPAQDADTPKARTAGGDSPLAQPGAQLLEGPVPKVAAVRRPLLGQPVRRLCPLGGLRGPRLGRRGRLLLQLPPPELLRSQPRRRSVSVHVHQAADQVRLPPCMTRGHASGMKLVSAGSQAFLRHPNDSFHLCWIHSIRRICSESPAAAIFPAYGRVRKSCQHVSSIQLNEFGPSIVRPHAAHLSSSFGSLAVSPGCQSSSCCPALS